MGARFGPPIDGKRPSKASLEPQDTELGAPTESHDTHLQSNQSRSFNSSSQTTAKKYDPLPDLKETTYVDSGP